jgi:dTDP-4-dehydrorhamnose reductase
MGKLRVVVTGAGGLLGRTLLDHAPPSWEITGLKRNNLDVGDEQSIESAFVRHRPDLVINCAAFTDVDGAESNPFGALLVNEVGPRLLSFAANQHGAKLVHISTDFVFDGDKATPYVEDDKPNPLSIYGETKLSGEHAVREICKDYLIVRTAWLYGDYGRNFPEIMRQLAERGSLNVVNDQSGSPTYAPHLVKALASNIERGLDGTLHLAGAGLCTREGWAIELFNELGSDVQITSALTSDFPTPAKRPKLSALVSEREGVIALPSWRDGVADYCRVLTNSNR